MLNRIRRALALTRARPLPKGRHRRPLPLSAASPGATEPSTLVLGWAPAVADHQQPLKGEDVALVRPYVLAWEARMRASRRPAVVAPHLSGDAWSTLVGTH